MSSTLLHNKTKQGSAPIYKKYAKTQESNWIDPTSKLKPSDLSKSSVDVAADDYPMIIEFNNILDNTSQVHSSVDIDQPLFQPSPKVLVFEHYAPFAVHEKKLYFRNNDSVARRIKVFQPESLFFELSAPKTPNGEPLKQSKIAAGMEVYYIVRFKPQEVRDYAIELVCSTEREKFLVPVRAVGMHPKMTFPDEINFGSCPVKSTTRKNLLVQNLGSSVARFTMRSMSPSYTCPTEELVVEAGGSYMIEMFFTPPTSSVTESEFEVEFTKGVKCYIAVSGSGINVDVSLSTPSVALDSSYISLASQKSMRIKNTSDVPIQFMWKSFSNEREEEQERARLLSEINRMESIEQSALHERIRNGYYGAFQIDYDEDRDGEDDDDDAVPLDARADEATLVRKYRNLRTALQNDSMQFIDDIFEMAPIEGHVWAHSEIEITITFRPDTAARYTCLAYLDISGRQDRLPLHMSGQGIGPHAALSFDVLDVGDVFINDEQTYDLAIVNKGDIPAQWTFMSSLTKFGNKFNFSPKEGFLKAGQSQAIKVKFDSDVLGEFNELFRFALQGNDDMLVCQIKGHIVGPTFHFDRQKIDFGTVSFDYLHSTVIRMVNTSRIPMVYNLHIPQDGTYLKKEFDITPSEGTLPAGEGIDVSIDFIPSTVKVYEYSLTVDVFGVGDMLLSVPLSAECKVSPLRIVAKDVEFGDCFVRFPYEQDLVLCNPTDVLHIKFEMLPQLLYTRSLGTYEAEPSVAVIEPGDTMRVKIRLVAQRLGTFKIPIMIAIAGSQEPPMQASIDCTCIGPRVLLDTTELKWGNIECLKDSMRSMRITNDSLIPASMKIFLKLARSKFELSAQQLVLEGGQSYDLELMANLDDSIVTKDECHILVDEGDSLMVPLSAKGIGTTMACSHDMQILDLGVQLTNNVFEKRVILENKGRRPQQLRWTNITVKEENINRAKKAAKAGKVEGQKLPKHLAPISALFTVAPEEITLRPRTATTFTFKGMSPLPGNFSEILSLESRVGKERMMKEIIRTEVRCNVVNPLLEFSKSRIDFVYAWEKDVVAMIQRTQLVLRNVSAISLTFLLKVEVPFNLNLFEHTLEPGEAVDVEIEFDPLYRDDLMTHFVDKQLSISYRSHPQKDTIPLTADISFPNLKFDLTAVNFGSVLNDINKTIRVKATNWSKVPTTYEWTLIDDPQARNPKIVQKNRKASTATVLPPGQVFDILPVRSVLQPGESEDIEFTMYGVANCKFVGVALCTVEGGPEYKLPLSGEASTVSFKIERCVVDFGKVIYTDRKDEEIIIINDGKVSFTYEIVPVNSNLTDILEVLPASGKVAPGDKFTVTLRLRPALPAPIAEVLMVHIAHFDAFPVTVYCQGVFPTAVISLPRHLKVGPMGETHHSVASLWESFVATASANILTPDERLLPPAEDALPPPVAGTTAVQPVFIPLPPADESVEDTHDTLKATHHQPPIPGKAPPQMLLEVEMQRMALCHHLSSRIEGLGTEGSKVGGGATPRSGLQSLINKYIDVKSIIAANYICDFGNVIVGQTKKKVFQVTNASFSGQLNWVFDKKHLAGTGFAVDPEKVSKLPEQASVDFAVRFTGRGAKLGRKTCILPLETKGAPTLNIILSVNVTMPEIDLSMDEIDLGRVLMGRSKQVFMRLHNTSPVTAQWRFKSVPGKEEGKITITPNEGSLRAGKKIILCIEFMPSESRFYSLESALKVESNTKSKLLKIFGEGVGTPLRFDPLHVELGPVIPFSEGDEKEVIISNMNETTVEIYSLEFDHTYRQEEEIMSAIEAYDGAGVLRTDPRSAGDALPKEVKEAHDLMLAQAAASAGDGSGEEGDLLSVGTKYQLPPIRVKPAPRDEALHQDFLVVGPPTSGVTSIATHLGKKLVLPVKRVDDLINEVATSDSDVGFLLRRSLDRLSITEKAALTARQQELHALAEQSKVEAEEQYKKDNKKAKPPFPEEIYRTAQVAAYTEFMSQSSFNADTLAEAIKYRLTWVDVGYGLIIDNIVSTIAGEEIIAAGLAQAIPNLIVSNVLVSGGEEGFAHRVAFLVDTKRADVARFSAAIVAIKKIVNKMSKAPTKGGRNTTKLDMTATTMHESDEIAVALPSGEEPWINPVTGLINELDTLEVRALEEKQKLLYYRQLLYQQSQQMNSSEEAISKLMRIWSPEGGLKTEPDAALPPSEFVDAADTEGEEAVAGGAGEGGVDGDIADILGDDLSTPSKLVFFVDYATKILPAVQANFKPAVSPKPMTAAVAVSGEEEIPAVGGGDGVAAVGEGGEESEVEAAPSPLSEGGLIDIVLEGDESEEAMYNTVMALLPAPKVPPIDKDAIPDPALYQVIRKPVPRAERKQIKNFEIIRVDEVATDAEGEAGEGAAAVANSEINRAIDGDPSKHFRWIIEPFGSVKIKVRFHSKKQGKFDTNLRFEVMGTQQSYTLHCTGHCEIPSINSDTRNVFMKRMRMLTVGAPPPLKRFVITENFYSFGPILLFKSPEWRTLVSRFASGETLTEEEEHNRQLVQTNVDVLRISNNGRYKCKVDFGFEQKQETPETTFFHVEPTELELEEGETKDIWLWAFPKEVKDYENTLVMCVSNNPAPIRFDVKCAGVVPTVVIDGPWNDALAEAEAAVAACTDKKLIKDLETKLAALKEALTLDFDRMLIGKTEQRQFEMTNTSLLPVAWEVDPGDFKESRNMFISPSSGVLLSGATVSIVLSFTSEEPLMLTGKFSLKYSDAEGGLLVPARSTVKSFRAVAEAYRIQAVSLTAAGDESGGSEVDFGLMRVGDYAIQTLKMGNKGKYLIGFKFIITKPALAALIKIEPEEGTIEPGSALTDIKLTFCAPNGELHLKGNKDIKVFISEPTTGEVVEKETFPLYVSAHTKYCRFRMQPSRGVTFGAIRFDSEPKTKRIELRNEGDFEFSYVVCPAITEHDELDVLEPSLFSAYAACVPTAQRVHELGEEYLTRVGAGGAAAAPAKGKDAKAPAGKGASAPAVSHGSLNPLIYDPDNLVRSTPPETPLTVGSFHVFPRFGTVQPGQSIGIDAKFDPSGCDTVREKLRICISGINPHESPAQILKSFELTAESCIPAITVDDFISIFEEQDVITSFAETAGKKGKEGAGKLESLPVGKVLYVEEDKMLAFGPVMCGTVSARGVMERIKISNPTKIDTKVRFKVVTSEMASEILAAEAAAVGGGGAASAAKGKEKPKEKAPPAKGGKGGSEEVVAPLPFTVHPETWDIPPHESRFVSVYFNPTEIKSYRAVFMATVDMEGSSTTAKKPSHGGKMLTFDLGGSGTLPCVAVEQPAERGADGSLLLDFGKVHIQLATKRKFILRNDGVMPVTCLFEMNGDSEFLFSQRGASLALQPGQREELTLTFAPKKVVDGGARTAQIKVTVLHNQFDSYTLNLTGLSYACDAMIDTIMDTADDDTVGESPVEKKNDQVTFDPINLAEGPGTSTQTVMLRSRSEHPLKFELSADESLSKIVSFSPQMGHLGPNGTREVTITINAVEPVKLDSSSAKCSLKRIEYKPNPSAIGGQADTEVEAAAESKTLWGLWDDSMKSVRPVTEDDIAQINGYDAALKDYNARVEAEAKKGKKGKPVGPPPEKCLLQLGPPQEDGSQMVYEIVPEPFNELVPGAEAQELNINCVVVADVVKYSCQGSGENILFKPTFMYQSTSHKFSFTNESHISLPISWTFEDIKRKGTARINTAGSTTRNLQSRGASNNANLPPIPCPFSINPEDCEVPGKSSKEFVLNFAPLECDDFVYLLRGETLNTPLSAVEGQPVAAVEPGAGSAVSNAIRMVIRGSARRPICHFDIQETPEYMTRRPPNMNNEIGLNSPIETGDIKIVELESTGLRTRNTFRFYITNPTAENYEFGWETAGEPSPAWRCVQSSGMLFSGKRVEMVFEYLPEEVAPAESFFRFKLLGVSKLEQLFLFAGKVLEPKVQFSSAKIDFHSVMLGGEGGSETVYIDNQEHLPFNFAFEKGTLLQLQGANGPVLDIEPKSGTVLPHSRFPVTFMFHPQEEVTYNFNIQCDIKRKPNKISINVKGEGYAVHPLLQLEQSEEQAALRGGERFMTLRPAPFINYADFGAVQVLDSVTKKLSVSNNGKYNFDYMWDTERQGTMISLSGGKMGGTLQKAGELVYGITFAPQREESLDSSMLSLTIAGKYTYTVIPRGTGVKPALRFSFMHHDFGPSFITSPGGSTVVEESSLRLVNHDPSNNIAVECIFQKTRALWVECPPTVLEPGGVIDVPIRFAPRDVKDYAFVVPFVVNGTGKVPVNIIGSGINARVELVSATQRRTNFGTVDVGAEARKSVGLVNKSKKAVTVQLIDDGQYGGGALADRCVTFFPQSSFTIAPRETATVSLLFAPNKRIATFAEDLLINFAGLSRKLLTVSGKAQGTEISLDTDSLPFGIVVMDSQKIKKLTLENTGDLPITFQWMEGTFGPHFSITPLSGKVNQGSEITFDVIFRPKFVDEDIRQENILLTIPGMSPLQLTCTGSSIIQPSETVQTLLFKSAARKAENKSIKLSNPTDKDWYLAPSLQGVDWSTPHEFKVSAKGSADMVITYFPLTMRPAPAVEPTDGSDSAHQGQLFLALPDGTAQLYKLRGYATEPECSGDLQVNTPAKQPANFLVKLSNWLPETQKFSVAYEFTEKASPASFIVVANAVEVGSNGTKEFPVRFVSSVEGVSKGTITFTNKATGEFAYYRFVATTTAADVLETITMESPVRQTARYIITVENPLGPHVPVNMGTAGAPHNWWTCDSKFVKINELAPISGNTEGTFEVEYRPLLPLQHPSEHLITITTRELGIFKYRLVVTATPPTLRQSLRFSVSLGSVQTETFIFKAFNTLKCDYACSLKRNDVFAAAKSVTVEAVAGGWLGDDIRVDINFEPTEMGEVRDTLVVSSPDGGDYTCELVATCVAPLPQGPFNLVNDGKTTDIPFRNCFSSASTWTFSVDSSAFRVVAPSAQVAAKTQGQCGVVFEPKEEHMGTPGGIMNAKLFIKCSSMPDVAPWVFYLRGRIDLTAQGDSKGKKK